MKILVIQQKMIGDVLTSSILFEVLRQHYPTATLYYLIDSNTLPVVEKNPFVDHFILHYPDKTKHSIELWRFIKSIRKEKFDIVIDVYSKLSSNLISYFSKAKIRISYNKKYTSFFYTHTVERKEHHKTSVGLEIYNRLLLLSPLGIQDHSNDIRPKIHLNNQEISNGKTFLESNNIHTNLPLYMISVLGSSEIKTYPAAYMSQIIDEIVAQTQGQILFNYIPKQEVEARLIYDSCKPETRKHIYFNVYGKNLREFLAITKHCSALIGNEGGAINMSKALNIPTFSIFSPWINKEAWNVFEDGKNHVSVHLKDFKPNLFKTELNKKLKHKSEVLYQHFTPEYIIPKLKTFLKDLNTKL